MFINNATEGTWSEAAALGYAAELLFDTDRRLLSLAALKAWLRVPIKLDQILIVFGDRGTPHGFVTWAYVTPETAARLGDGRRRPLYPEDWNDGTMLWIVDVVAPYGDLARVMQAARDRLRPHHRIVGFADRRDGRRRLLRRAVS